MREMLTALVMFFGTLWCATTSSVPPQVNTNSHKPKAIETPAVAEPVVKPTPVSDPLGEW